MTIDSAAVAELRASATAVSSTPALASLKEWLPSIVPANPIRAAVEGAMLPIFVFTLVFAFALRRVDPAHSRPLLGALEAVKEASVTIVRWILLLAPSVCLLWRSAWALVSALPWLARSDTTC